MTVNEAIFKTLRLIDIGFAAGSASLARKRISEHMEIHGIEAAFAPIISVNSGGIHGEGSCDDVHFSKANTVIIDLGIKFDGGMTDMTRTLVRVGTVYWWRYEQLTYLAYYLASLSLTDAEEAYSKTLKACAQEQKHRLGHRITADEIHAGDLSSVKSGDLYTIEPGFYGDGWGMRHENTYIKD